MFLGSFSYIFMTFFGSNYCKKIKKFGEICKNNCFYCLFWCFFQNNAKKMSKYDVKVIFWPKVLCIFDRNDGFDQIMCLQKSFFDKKCKIKKRAFFWKKNMRYTVFSVQKSRFFFKWAFIQGFWEKSSKNKGFENIWPVFARKPRFILRFSTCKFWVWFFL